MAYGVAHPTAYAVVCLEIKKDVCVYDCFAGFDANLFKFIIILLIFKHKIFRLGAFYNIYHFLFPGKVWSDSDIPLGNRA